MHKKAAYKIILWSVVYAFYIIFILLSFLESYGPPNEATSQWKYDHAQLHYALISLPAFFLYIFLVLKDIKLIKYVRWFIYSLVYIEVFFASHICLMVFGPAVMWISLLTVQVGMIAYIILISNAAKKDREDFKNAELKNQDVSNDS